MEEQEILATILMKLHRGGYWGGRHTSVENLKHGFAGHLKGKVMRVIDNLLRSNWMIVKPKSDSLHVSLDTHFKPEICDFLKSQGLNMS